MSLQGQTRRQRQHRVATHQQKLELETESDGCSQGDPGSDGEEPDTCLIERLFQVPPELCNSEQVIDFPASVSLSTKSKLL